MSIDKIKPSFGHREWANKWLMDKMHKLLTDNLWASLQSDPVYKKQLDRLMSSEFCDIDPSFLGFIDFYHYLSLLLPSDRVIYDLGCAYASQSYFFRGFKQYVGVDLMVGVDNRICPPNAVHFKMSIGDFIRKNDIVDKHFAFCCYVPPWSGDNEELVRRHFRHVLVYYPMR